ncbi:DUF1653 domain-containing protein [Roseateles sp. MS654]|uniref:DUF1653 domain-containing protein n=1 Tax=Roseateles sp. MS654 TaxID=3412685 RepID=UPI003C2D4D11
MSASPSAAPSPDATGHGAGDPLAPLPEAPAGRYRHYKGGEYEVRGVVRHSETLEPLVLYAPLYNDSGLWVRPYAMFFGTVEIDGVCQPRFAPISG